MGLAADIQPDDSRGPAPEVLFARQPLLDEEGHLSGYELIYRGAKPTSPHAATSHVALTALSDMGLDVATGGSPAFLNVTNEFLLEMDPLPFGPDGVVLEISAERDASTEFEDRVRRLAEDGYTLALDGYMDDCRAVRLLEHCAIAKVDIRIISQIQMKTVAPFLRDQGVSPVAFGVETHALRDRCAEAGFELFQGDFICSPREVMGTVPESSLGAVRLAAAITQAPTGDVSALEKAISLDPALSLRLLRFVNSAAFAIRNQIGSVRQAIVLLGPGTVRQWATMLVLSGLTDNQNPLVATALARGRLCEAVAERQGANDPAAYFFVGMMSVADALLSMPMEQALAELPLADEVAAALLTRAGEKGQALKIAEACERAAWADAVLDGFTSEDLAVMHVEALAWADANLRGVL